MKHKYKQILRRTLSFALALLFILPASFTVGADTNPFSGVAAEYYDTLLEKGFPTDYAYALTELHLLHPSWEFSPLLITETEPTYTWEYILEKETEDPSNNLIYASDAYAAYRHPTNTELYDSSAYQVSNEGLSYFMDPRNFLNETDIFQFLDLSATAGISSEAVEAVLLGTFMENAVLENGKTFAEYFIEVGAELGINPIFLAVKARQEQGVNGTSPIISGSCGDLLDEFYTNNVQTGESGLLVLAPDEGYTSEELLALNGYYNMYNIKASGNGVFSIYYNAMSYASKTGSEAKAEEWGSPAWDTLWKSIWGGAYIIKRNYVSDYKNTIYLQKFNVDSRAYGNFWNQYMQNVTGAFTEARTFYTSFASTKMLDSACSFLIPVYGGMPQSPCADPAGGSCASLKAAPLKYDRSHVLTSPALTAAENAPSYERITASPLGALPLSCTVEHSYGVTAIEYAWDGNGEWQRLSDSGTADTEIPIPFDTGDAHVLTLRGIADYDHAVSTKKNNYAFLIAVLYVDVVTAKDITLTLKNGDSEISLTYPAGTEFPLPSLSEEGFIGWTDENGALFAPGMTVKPSEDSVYHALTVRFEQLDGAAFVKSGEGAILRFFAALDAESMLRLSLSDATVTFYATDETNGETLLSTASAREDFSAYGRNWKMLTTDTAPILPENADTVHKVSFYISVTYANGRTRIYNALASTENERSIREVALAALADTNEEYPASVAEALREFTTQAPQRRQP